MFLPLSRKFEISSNLTFFHVNCHENLHTFPFFDFLRKSLNSFRFRKQYRKNKYFKFWQHQSKFFKTYMRIGSFLTHNFLNAKIMILRRCGTEFCDNFRESAKTKILFSTLLAIVQRIKKGIENFVFCHDWWFINSKLFKVKVAEEKTTVFRISSRFPQTCSPGPHTYSSWREDIKGTILTFPIFVYRIKTFL
jgi:hypothetical protein